MSEHMFKKFDADLESIRAKVLQMGGLVEQQINNAIEALSNGDTSLAERVIVNDAAVNNLEVALHEDCDQLIVRRQPAAVDLRMIMTVVKLVTDLERVGDEAQKIARMTKLLYETDQLLMPRFSHIRHMSDTGVEMLRSALDAFARMDASAAMSVLRKDMEVDNEFRAALRHLITFMMEDPRKISMAIDILFVIKALERIGDHAKNMAEYVVYFVKGKDIRHTSLEEIQRQIED